MVDNTDLAKQTSVAFSLLVTTTAIVFFTVGLSDVAPIDNSIQAVVVLKALLRSSTKLISTTNICKATQLPNIESEIPVELDLSVPAYLCVDDDLAVCSISLLSERLKVTEKQVLKMKFGEVMDWLIAADANYKIYALDHQAIISYALEPSSSPSSDKTTSFGNRPFTLHLNDLREGQSRFAVPAKFLRGHQTMTAFVSYSRKGQVNLVAQIFFNRDFSWNTPFYRVDYSRWKRIIDDLVEQLETEDSENMTLGDIERYLIKSRRSIMDSGAEIAGYKISKKQLINWGLFLITITQLLFWLHFKTLVWRMSADDKAKHYSFIVMYGDRTSRICAYLAAVVLPLTVSRLVSINLLPAVASILLNTSALLAALIHLRFCDLWDKLAPATPPLILNPNRYWMIPYFVVSSLASCSCALLLAVVFYWTIEQVDNFALLYNSIEIGMIDGAFFILIAPLIKRSLRRAWIAGFLFVWGTVLLFLILLFSEYHIVAPLLGNDASHTLFGLDLSCINLPINNWFSTIHGQIDLAFFIINTVLSTGFTVILLTHLEKRGVLSPVPSQSDIAENAYALWKKKGIASDDGVNWSEAETEMVQNLQKPLNVLLYWIKRLVLRIFRR